MQINWTSKALSDITRLYEFLALVNKPAAVSVVRALTSAPASLSAHPRIGEKLDGYDPHEIRRLLVGNYEMRYEIRDATIYILRLWHTREARIADV